MESPLKAEAEMSTLNLEVPKGTEPRVALDSGDYSLTFEAPMEGLTLAFPEREIVIPPGTREAHLLKTTHGVLPVEDFPIRQWRLEKTLPGSQALALSADGSRLGVLNGNLTIYGLDLERRLTFEGQGFEAVALNGETVAIGLPQTGEVRLYEAKGLTTTFKGAPGFGRALTFSSDGATLAIGSPQEGSSKGAVYVSKLYRGVWSNPLEAKVIGMGGRFGSSLALNADGSTLAIASPIGNSGVYFSYWQRPTLFGALVTPKGNDTFGIWSYPGDCKIAMPDGNSGCNLSMHADGKTLLIGAPFGNSMRGDVYLTRIGILVHRPEGRSPGCLDYEGRSVSIGRRLAAFSALGRVAVTPFDRIGSPYPDEMILSSKPGFGTQVILSPDDTRLFVTSPDDNLTYVYRHV